jgi:hypothetical protein
MPIVGGAQWYAMKGVPQYAAPCELELATKYEWPSAKSICRRGEAAHRHTVTTSRFYLRRQVQFTGQCKVPALATTDLQHKTVLYAKRLQQFLRFQAK